MRASFAKLHFKCEKIRIKDKYFKPQGSGLLLNFSGERNPKEVFKHFDNFSIQKAILYVRNVNFHYVARRIVIKLNGIPNMNVLH